MGEFNMDTAVTASPEYLERAPDLAWKDQESHVMLLRMRNFIADILMNEDLRAESATTGLQKSDLIAMSERMSSLLGLYNRTFDLYEDYTNYVDEYITNISMTMNAYDRSKIADILDRIEVECFKVFEQYATGWMPYLAPYGYVFKCKDGIWRFYKDKEGDN